MKTRYLLMTISLFFIPRSSFGKISETSQVENYLEQWMNQDQTVKVAKENYTSSEKAENPFYFSFLPKVEFLHENTWNRPKEEHYSTSLKSNINLFNGYNDRSTYSLMSLKKEEKAIIVEKSTLETEKLFLNLLFDYMEKQQNINIYKESLELKEKFLTMSRDRYNKGHISQLELDRIIVDKNLTRSKLYSEQQLLLEKESLLKQKITLDLSNIVWPWSDLTTAKEKELKDTLLKPKAENHPTVRIEAIKRDQTDLNLTKIKSEFFPKIELSHELRFKDYLHNHDNRSSQLLFFSISYPLFDRFETLSKREWAIVEKRDAQLALKNAEDHLNEEWVTLSLQFPITLNETRLSKENLQLSEKIYQTTLSHYYQGKISLDQLLEEQQRFLESKIIYNKILSQLHHQVTNLCYINGKYFKDCFL